MTVRKNTDRRTRFIDMLQTPLGPKRLINSQNHRHSRTPGDRRRAETDQHQRPSGGGGEFGAAVTADRGRQSVERRVAGCPNRVASRKSTAPSAPLTEYPRAGPRCQATRRKSASSDAGSMDNGKPIRESRDIDIPARGARASISRWLGRSAHASRPPDLHRSAFAGQIIPWNFPLMLAWKVAPGAVAAGNTVVLKPAGTRR